MEILLIACMLAYAAGAQSEQSKLGVSPAQRDILREQTRHEKAIRKIADKHGTTPSETRKSAPSPWKAAPPAAPATSVSEAFRSGYRSHSPIERVATPPGRRAGTWAAQGVAWAQGSGRGALREFRKRHRAAGRGDPAPVLVPLPPSHPPTVPPMPAEPPTVGADGGQGVSLTKPTVDAGIPLGAPTAPEPVTEELTKTTGDTTAEGVGRMAAEVTYESAMDESDELSIMCDDDVRVYGRIHDRAEREIGRGDTLIAAMQDAGFGPGVIGWVARCKENYGVIRSEVDDLQHNTIAQGEAVVKAKALLEAGQGVYAGIAQDMEDVAERDAYISDAVDAEDTSADTEVYETKAA